MTKTTHVTWNSVKVDVAVKAQHQDLNALNLCELLQFYFKHFNTWLKKCQFKLSSSEKIKSLSNCKNQKHLNNNLFPTGIAYLV